MTFDEAYDWRSLKDPTGIALGSITARDVYAALTKGSLGKRHPTFAIQFSGGDRGLRYKFTDFSSDIYHEELISCWQDIPDSVQQPGGPKCIFRWGIGGDFGSGGSNSSDLVRQVALEGRCTKNHDGMTSRFEPGSVLLSSVYMRGVRVKLAVDEPLMIAELQDFIGSDFKQIEPPAYKPLPLTEAAMRQLRETGWC